MPREVSTVGVSTRGGSLHISSAGLISDSTLGGMGFHHGNTGLIDGTVELLRPELLLYEPMLFQDWNPVVSCAAAS
jgi:hypothetical protein